MCLAGLKAATENIQIRILHVDDDSSVQEITKLMLLDLNGGFEIDRACCVDEAFKKLSNKQYDVVVSDYEMPQKDGLHFLNELREQKSKIPFILFTGKGREEVAIQALNLGVDAYHNKQGSPETVYGELFHSINLVVDRSKAKRALEESEKRYHALMEKASEAIFVHNIHGQIVDVNQKACRNLGYTKEELLKITVADIDGEAIKAGKGDLLWPRVIAGESFTFESSHKRKDGSVFPIEVSIGSISVGNEIFIMGLSRDITERKRTEAILKS
jgi:PAS domain S-box-containing protein